MTTVSPIGSRRAGEDARVELLSSVDSLAAAGAGLLTGVIYWLGSAPGVLFGDGGELQFAVWTAGLPHPTGYPLYMLLGWAWTHLLAGLNLATPARALNLFSVASAALAVSLTYLLARVLIELSLPETPLLAQRLAGLLAALTFAFTPTFWSQALVAEVYALHAALVALLLGLALRWQKRLELERAGGVLEPLTFRSRPTPALMVMALVLGLSLAHHRTSLLLAPVLILFVWRQDGYRLRHPRWLLSLSLLAALPLLLYLYIPLRAPHTPYLSMPLSPGRTLELIDRSPMGLVNYASGQMFAGHLRGLGEGLAALPGLLDLFQAELGWVGLGMAILGLLCLAGSGQRRPLWLTASSFLVLTGFNLLYDIGDIHVFYIASYLIAACWIGLAGAYVAQEALALIERGRDRLSLLAGAKPAALASLVVLAPLIILPLSLFISHADHLDRSGHVRPARWWEQLLQSAPPADALLISNDRDEMMSLWYAQQVEGKRPDLLGLFPGLLPGENWANVGQTLEQALSSGRPVYLVKPMPGLEVKALLGPANRAGLTAVNGLAAVNPPQRPQEAALGNLVRLVGYDVAPRHLAPGQALQVDLHWQPLRNIPTNLTSFVHLQLEDGRRIAQSDVLLGGVYYPTSIWKPGELLLDRHRLAVPADAPSGPYDLFAGLYELIDEEATAVASIELTGKVGGQPPAEARSAPVDNPFYANLNDEILLVGYDLAGGRLALRNANQSPLTLATPANELRVTLLWQAARTMAVDYTVFVHLLDEAGAIVAQREFRPFGGQYPTSVWDQGELLAGAYILPLAENLPSGSYRVMVGLYLAQTQIRLPAYDDRGQRLANDRVELAQIEIN